MQSQIDLVVEPTAHPRARKFILDRDVRAGEAVRFAEAAACAHVPMATNLLAVPGVAEVHFAGNVITVTAHRSADWAALEVEARRVIRDRLEAHDPAMRPNDGRVPAAPVGDLAVIDGILEQTIRPYIRSHGGEIELLQYDPESKRLLMSYQGTCGHCPASSSGTLEVIQQILRDSFDPAITLEIV